MIAFYALLALIAIALLVCAIRDYLELREPREPTDLELARGHRRARLDLADALARDKRNAKPNRRKP